jgi:hypothetical protein
MLKVVELNLDGAFRRLGLLHCRVSPVPGRLYP